jgi:hypothetical protein
MVVEYWMGESWTNAHCFLFNGNVNNIDETKQNNVHALEWIHYKTF